MGEPGGMTVHDFQTSLARSKAYEDAPWWGEVYRRAFPDLQASVSVRNDGWAQRGGIDRVLTLGSGRTVTVDEKVREKDWGDFALERWSDRERRVPGWIQKPLACDFIAYAFVPSQTCYLLPFLSLKRAWTLHGRHWIENAEAERFGYKIAVAPNRTYSTECVCVPRDDLFTALTDAMSVSWKEAA